MAVGDITISDSTSNRATYSFRIKDGDGSHSMYMHWSTMQGTNYLKNFVFEWQWRGVPKGSVGEGEGGNTNWSSWSTKTLAVSSCHPYQVYNSDRWYWYVPLGSVVTESLMNGGSWSYGSRTYDQVQIRFRMHANYVDGTLDELGNSYSPTSQADVWIGFFPNYKLKEIYQQGTDVIITYTADGWTRKDDRYRVLSLTSGGRSLLASGTAGNQAGLVQKLGWISVPLSALQFIPNRGSSVYVKLRWNTSYHETEYSGYTDASATLTFTDESEANTPVGDVTVNGDGSISVGVGDSGDNGNDIYEAVVKIDIDGFEFDQVVLNKVDMANAMLNFPPLGKEITVQIQGSTVTGGVSDVVEKTVFVPADGRILLDAFDQDGERVGKQCVLTANIDWDVSRKREKEVVKLSGRKRPSAFFGEGGETSVSLSGSVKWDGLGQFNADDFYALGDADLVCIRFPDGQRFVSTIDTVTTSESASDKCTKVKINATEVE